MLIPPGLPPPGLSRKESREISLPDTQVKVCGKNYWLDNIAGATILKLMYADNWRIIDPGVNDIGCATILYNPVTITPPQIMVKVSELLEAEQTEPAEVWEWLRGRAARMIKHPIELVVDIVTLYTIYTWFHILEPKKTFMAVSGMYGTGKSAVAAFIKAYGRYAIESPPGAKSSEFELALVRGVMIIDEAEQLKKSELARLRRIYDGLKVSKFMGRKGGYELMELMLNSPVVLVGTHLPPDPALLSRALVVKMHYGKPEEHPPHIYSVESRKARARMLLFHLTHHKEWIQHLEACRTAYKDRLTARELDNFSPICATNRLLGRPVPEESIIDYVGFSNYASITVLRARRVVFDVAQQILENGTPEGQMVRISEADFQAIIDLTAERYAMDMREKDYVTIYFRSAAYLEGESLYFYRRDLERLATVEDGIEFIRRYAPTLLSEDNPS